MKHEITRYICRGGDYDDKLVVDLVYDLYIWGAITIGFQGHVDVQKVYGSRPREPQVCQNGLHHYNLAVVAICGFETRSFCILIWNFVWASLPWILTNSDVHHMFTICSLICTWFLIGKNWPCLDSGCHHSWHCWETRRRCPAGLERSDMQTAVSITSTYFHWFQHVPCRVGFASCEHWSVAIARLCCPPFTYLMAPVAPVSILFAPLKSLNLTSSVSKQFCNMFQPIFSTSQLVSNIFQPIFSNIFQSQLVWFLIFRHFFHIFPTIFHPFSHFSSWIEGITEFLGVGSEQRTCALRAGPEGARVRFVQRQALTELPKPQGETGDIGKSLGNHRKSWEMWSLSFIVMHYPIIHVVFWMFGDVLEHLLGYDMLRCLSWRESRKDWTRRVLWIVMTKGIVNSKKVDGRWDAGSTAIFGHRPHLGFVKRSR